MEHIHIYAGWAAGIFSLVAYIPYTVSILKKKTQPNRATWIIWTVVSLTMLFSYDAVGANETIWLLRAFALGTVITMLLSLKYGTGGWTRFDRGCLITAAVSLFAWWVFDSPLSALLISLFVDALGSLPTIKKLYHDSESENKTAWALFFIGSLSNVIAVNTWTFEIAIHPVIMFTTLSTIFILVFLKPKKLLTLRI
ncbi:hypothetical protein COB64_04065 [Candidatus Wolfebacteria bacterium]|nr:MAG: hypothetical protein COB64_04065 [Candidatus Wolfebacteria bacterium]